MNNAFILQGIKKIHLDSVRPFPLWALLLTLLCGVLIAAWYYLCSPLQEQLEARLRAYPDQLNSLQQLNRTLLVYRGKSLPVPGISEAEFANLKAKLVAQGIQFNLMRLDKTSPAQISLQINELEFSRWLELVEDFRKNNALYATEVSIKKIGANAGVVQVTATLVQAP